MYKDEERVSRRLQDEKEAAELEKWRKQKFGDKNSDQKKCDVKK